MTNRRSGVMGIWSAGDELFDMGEPKTPKEIAEHKTCMALLDIRLATEDLIRLRNDEASRPVVAAQEAELWNLKNGIEFLLTSIATDHAAKSSHLKVVR